MVSALAADETVVAAAADAVADAADGLDLVLASDPRLPDVGEPDEFAVSDAHGGHAFGVNRDGETRIGSTRFVTGAFQGLRVVDGEDRLAFEVGEDGRVFIAGLTPDSLAPKAVHVLIGLGQSNMSGRAVTDPGLDLPDPRLWQFGAGANHLTRAAVPLDMVDVASGLSPLTVLGRLWLQRIPADEVVVLVPAAKGASVLGDTTTTSGNGVWNAAYVGASLDLWGAAKTQIGHMLVAVAEKWPAAVVQVVGAFWCQGEANDNSTATATYAGRLDAIVEDLRDVLADPGLPFVVGGMVPEYVVSASRSNTQAAHVDTPNRLLRSGFAEGVANCGGFDDDVVHYNREGVVVLAARLAEAYDRALLNTSGSLPVAPSSVSALLVGGLLTVQWAQPWCRATGFVPEYDSGGGWTAIPHTGVSASVSVSGVSAPVQVRVATVNAHGTSHPTTPVYATLGD